MIVPVGAIKKLTAIKSHYLWVKVINLEGRKFVFVKLTVMVTPMKLNVKIVSSINAKYLHYPSFMLGNAISYLNSPANQEKEKQYKTL